MLKPRRLKRPAMRARTPGLFSTRTDKVCLLMFSSPSEVVLVELRREVAGILDFVVAGASGDHRPDHGVAVDPEVHEYGLVVDRHRLLDGGVHVLGRLAGEAYTDVGLRQLHEVRDTLAVQVGVGVADRKSTRLNSSQY